MAEDIEKQTYVVTERAGPRVAGRPVERGQELDLTAGEAEHDHREGAIVLKGKELAKGFTGASRRADRLRQEASDFKARKAPPPAADAAPAAAAAARAPKAKGGGVAKAPAGDAGEGSQ
jgi:hypothetical protein